VAIVNGIYIWQEDFDMTVANLRQAYSDTHRRNLPKKLWNKERWTP
jgi:hypothetical protein